MDISRIFYLKINLKKTNILTSFFLALSFYSYDNGIFFSLSMQRLLAEIYFYPVLCPEAFLKTSRHESPPLPNRSAFARGKRAKPSFSPFALNVVYVN